MATSEWSGFTEEEIKHLNNKTKLKQTHKKASLTNGSVKPKPKKNMADPIKKSLDFDSPPTHKNGVITNGSLKTNGHPKEVVPLVSAEESAVITRTDHSNVPDSSGLSQGLILQVTSNNLKYGPEISSIIPNESSYSKDERIQEVMTMDPAEKQRDKQALMDKYEQAQVKIKEENLKRRELLARALADRKRRTQEEAVKISKIQEELATLDSQLSSDVAILRDYIEVASQEFSEAQKRYHKAEKEFVESKLELFKRLDRKEHLTEHLYAIIQDNEARKAYRLADMMQELNLDIGDMEANGFAPPCVINDNKRYSLLGALPDSEEFIYDQQQTPLGTDV